MGSNCPGSTQNMFYCMSEGKTSVPSLHIRGHNYSNVTTFKSQTRGCVQNLKIVKNRPQLIENGRHFLRILPMGSHSCYEAFGMNPTSTNLTNGDESPQVVDPWYSNSSLISRRASLLSAKPLMQRQTHLKQNGHTIPFKVSPTEHKPSQSPSWANPI